MSVRRPIALLVLENGAVFRGRSFGYETDALGEACFNTSMTGYQEILTDPSYCRQIVTLTYPMIGNYGVCQAEMESARIQAAGLVVKEYVAQPSNFNAERNLAEFLQEYRTPAMDGIDTRRLTLMLRKEGAMRSGLFVGRDYHPDMLEAVRQSPEMSGQDLASVVSARAAYNFGEQSGKKYRVAVLDFGVKTNILRMLDRAGFAVRVYPADIRWPELSAESPDAFFLSNGPGDPEPLQYAVETVRAIIDSRKPVFGICLGHQLIGLASGRHTFKLKFGHRGGNQPVKNQLTGQVEITSQNHGFAVAAEGEGGVRITHTNLNDQTVEGFRAEDRPIMSVQYHPEASPGPHDAAYLFDEFYQMVEQNAAS
ncbi:MAG: glutamine-hydrolyzing carbamoyl-phosphate synthase small subunit [Leptospirales bacterium]|nr:glutamine-hydrolyzing carbamoyl-phosphate synthase small subunit [Leptospirales bacterium]